MPNIVSIFIIIATLIVATMHVIPGINYRPKPQGLETGALNKNKPNWVSSFVEKTDPHYIAPLQRMDFTGLPDCLSHLSRKTTIVKHDKESLVAYRQSTLFNFTDWLYIRADGQATSSATMGYYDFNKNREWVEEIRRACS